MSRVPRQPAGPRWRSRARSPSPEPGSGISRLVEIRRAYRRLPVASALRRTGVPARLERALLRRLTAGRPTVVPAAGLTLEVPADAVLGYLDDRYEPETCAVLQALLRPGDVAVDVGAYVGLFTLLMARAVGSTGTVHGVEPSPASRRLLEANMARHRDEGWAPIVVHATACGATEGEARLTESGTGERNSLLGDDGAGRIVRVATLDALVAPPVRLVKVDVEGGELDVLAGAAGLLGASDRPHLLVEWNPRAQAGAGSRPVALVERLQALGYALALLDLPSSTPEPRDLDALVTTAHRLPEGWYCTILAT